MKIQIKLTHMMLGDKNKKPNTQKTTDFKESAPALLHTAEFCFHLAAAVITLTDWLPLMASWSIQGG